MQIKFREPVRLYHDGRHIDCDYTVFVTRRGIGSTTLGYVFSDYFAQGCTWGEVAFFLHLLTSDKFYKAGNLRVPVTRASSIEGIKLLAPLWTTEAERLRLKGQFVNALKPDRDYVAEMARLRTLDEATRRLYDKEWSECKAFVDQLRAALKKKKEREGDRAPLLEVPRPNRQRRS